MSDPGLPSPIHVAVAAFDGISPFHLSVPCMVFGERHGALALPFQVSVCALASMAGPHAIRSSAGFSIQTEHGLAMLAAADMIVVPSWPSELPAIPADLLQALRSAHARGARLVGLCLGAFVLAEAGLLDGRGATTHWALAGEFARRYPKVRLDANVLYVDEGDVITSAGTAAGIDCCLHVLRAQYGSDVAAQVARRLVVAPHRQGGQAQYIEQPLPALASDDRLSRVLTWMQAHLAEPHSLDQLAQRALMSRRSFTRRFQKLTGTTVGQWLLHQRLAQAQRQLEATRRSIDDIAADSGFASAVVMRRQFMQHLHTTPSAYRREFQGATP